MKVSGSALIKTSSRNVLATFPVLFTVPPGTTTVLVQLSVAGVITTLPTNSTILNGLTFSDLDANGCSNQFASSYRNVIKSPVFCTLVSSKVKFSLRSALVVLTLSANAGSNSNE